MKFQVIRGTAFGLSSMFSRLGSVSAPLLMYLTPPLTPDDSPLMRLPMAAYGACMIIAAVLCLWLWPETAWINVVDSLEEGEAAASSYNPWTAWCCFGCKEPRNDRNSFQHGVEKEKEDNVIN